MQHNLHVHACTHESCTCMYVWCPTCMRVCMMHYCACISVSYLHACVHDALLCIPIPTVTRNLYKSKYMTLSQVLANWQADTHALLQRDCARIYTHTYLWTHTRATFLRTHIHARANTPAKEDPLTIIEIRAFGSSTPRPWIRCYEEFLFVLDCFGVRNELWYNRKQTRMQGLGINALMYCNIHWNYSDVRRRYKRTSVYR